MAELPVDVRELLKKPSDDMERPRPLADGHYIGEVLGQPEFDLTRGEKQTHLVRFNYKILEACDDVAADANAGIDLTRREVRQEFFITPAALYRLGDAVDGILGKAPGVGVDERLPDVQGARVQLRLRERVDRRTGEKTGYNEVVTVVAA
jgi:hypothetical protein